MKDMHRWNLAKTRANFEPLSPISFLQRTARIYPEHPAVVYGTTRRTYSEFVIRCRQISSFLEKRSIGEGDVVSAMLPNIPAMLELHFAGVANGRVLHPISTRLDAKAVRFQLEHSKSRVIFFDREYASIVESAVTEMTEAPLLVEVVDTYAHYSQKASVHLSYEEALSQGEPCAEIVGPKDEWQAIALSYTSGTTGNPKGVVTHHRGAYLNSVANTVAWSMPHHPVYLWVLPMFHCDGWCFPWTVTQLAGTHVCLRKVEAETIFALSERERVSHICAAPVVLSMLATEAQQRGIRFTNPVEILTAGAAPPPPIIEAVEKVNACVTQVYGLTETYSSLAISVWKAKWNGLHVHERCHLKARQGVQYPGCEELDVIDRMGQSVPWDGESMGEVVVRGNTVMSGYLENPAATDESFAGGWFHTGDLATRDVDGFIAVKDRTKDMINSGGEKISSIEVEEVLFEHPDVLEVAVVAAPDDKWGEVPWAFVAVRPGAHLSEEQLLIYCRERLARYKVPKRFVFGDLERTATGKIQKFRLRTMAADAVRSELAARGAA